MSITFAGFNLIQEDRDGRLADWFERWINYQDIRAVAAWPGAVFSKIPGLLSQPNWSERLTPRLNTWVWPSGASRWGYGFFLCDGKTKSNIESALSSAAGGTNPTATLVLKDDVYNLQRSFACYLLPPRPVSADNTDPNSLWILPIVDVRYFWQFINFESAKTVSSSAFGTWATLFSNFPIKPTFSPGNINSAYLVPHQWLMTRLQYQNAAVILDVLAHSVGLRLAESPPGNWALQSFTDANAQRIAQITPANAIGALQAGILPGGPAGLGAITPFRVDVIFPAQAQGIAEAENLKDGFTISTTAASAGQSGPTNLNYVKTIRSTAMANFTGGGGNPDNLTSLTALAKQIATDFYGWISWYQDEVFPGLAQFALTGFDDYYEFCMGRLASDGSILNYTRVHTLPHNFCCDDLLHWDSTVANWSFTDAATPPVTHNASAPTWEWGKIVFGTLQGNLPANGQQVISVTDADVPIPAFTQPDATTNAYLLVSEVQGNAIASGKVAAINDGNKWAVLNGGGSAAPITITTCTCSTYIGSIGFGSTTTGYSGTFTLTGGGTVTALVPLGGCLPGVVYQVAQLSSGAYQILDPTRIFYVKSANSIVSTNGSGFITSSAASLMQGTQGAETAVAGVTLTIVLREGQILSNRIYKVYVTDTNSMEVINAEQEAMGWLSGSGAPKVAPATVGPLCAGGSVTAYLRDGIMYDNLRRYKMFHFDSDTSGGPVGGWEIVDPTLEGPGLISAANIAAGASGAVVILDESAGIGNKNQTTISVTMFNGCSVAANINHRVRWAWNKDSAAFEIVQIG